MVVTEFRVNDKVIPIIANLSIFDTQFSEIGMLRSKVPALKLAEFRVVGPSTSVKDFWAQIPGSQLYIGDGGRWPGFYSFR